MKTAVEWLQEALRLTFEQQMQFEGLFQQSKEMEKQQIIDAYSAAENSCEFLIEEHRWQRFYSEQYYNETFK